MLDHDDAVVVDGVRGEGILEATRFFSARLLHERANCREQSAPVCRIDRDSADDQDLHGSSSVRLHRLSKHLGLPVGPPRLTRTRFVVRSGDESAPA